MTNSRGATTDFGFNGLLSSGSSGEAAGSQTWSVLDVNGDAKPDLVVHTQRVTASGWFLPFGTAPNRYWKAYLGSATPLAATVSTAITDGVTLYPNPTNGQVTLSGPISLTGQPYAMVDVLGRTLRTGLISAAEFTLNVQALPAGVYGVRIGTDGHLLRFVKQ